MKHIALAALLLLPVVAMADEAPPDPPIVQALKNNVIKLTGDSLNQQAEVIALRARIDELQKQIEAAKKPAETK